MKQTPLLILGDGPQQGTGLARIVRDIATRAAAMPEFRVGTFGRLGHYSRHLPYYQYNFHPSVESQWGELELEAAWQDFAGQERGVVLTVWDATRLTWLGMPQTLPDGPLRQWLLQRPFRLWGYFPVDSTAPDGTIGALGRATVAGFDRVMAYSQFGAKALNTGDWCPHGLDLGVWKPRGRGAGREMLRTKSGGRLTLCDDDVLVGCVATNQPRKDWGLVAATCALLKQHYGRRFRAWWHVDTLERSHSWNMLALLQDFGLGDSVMLVVDEWRDAEMARAYSACNVTLAPGMEGFGYPATESMACGTPVVTGAGHGGSEFVTAVGGVLMSPVGDRIEGPHNMIRHVHDPERWKNTVVALVEDDRDPRTVAESVGYLSWETLWKGYWQKWLRVDL